MPAKMARSDPQTPFGRLEWCDSRPHLAARLPTGSENAYHSRQFRFHPGNPG